MVGIRTGITLLRNPNVGRLFASYLISYAGTAMAPIALAFGVLELTGSTSDASIVIAAPTLAAIVVLLVGGVIADRSSRKKVIVSAELLAMCAQLAIAFLFISAQATVAWLTVFMLINGIAIAFHAPAATGFIVQLVERDQLQSANALLGTARNAAMAGGAALGGILVAFFGAGITFLIDAISFGISALLISSMQPRISMQPQVATVLEDLRIGWREFTSHTWLWVIVLQFSLIVGATEAVFGLIGPAVARDQLNGASDWGAIVSGFGIGTLVGGIIALQIHPKYPMRFGTLCVFFLAGIALTLAEPMPLVAIICAAFVAGVAGQLFATLWYTMLQIKVPEQMLSRVSAYDHLGSIVLAPLGIVVAGWSYEQFGFRNTLMVCAGIVVLSTALALCVRDVRMMTRD